MVTKYGMSAIGPVSYDDGGEVFIGRDFAHSKAYSEKTAADIDAEVKHIMTLQYRKTEQILTENMVALHEWLKNFLERKPLTVKNLKNVLKYKKEETIMAQVTKKI